MYLHHTKGVVEALIDVAKGSSGTDVLPISLLSLAKIAKEDGEQAEKMVRVLAGLSLVCSMLQ